MTDPELLKVWIALLAFAGGIIAALLGFWKSSEPFAIKKFLTSIVAAFGSALVFPFAYDNLGDSLTYAIGAAAFLSGMGVDLGKNGVVGLLKSSPAVPK